MLPCHYIQHSPCPLSTVLPNDYYAVTDSIDLIEQINSSTVLNDFAAKQAVQSKLQTSLLTLLQQDNHDDLVIRLFLAAVNDLDIDIAQTKTQAIAQQAYQQQLTTHTYIQGTQNALYTQTPYYQARIQYQQSPS